MTHYFPKTCDNKHTICLDQVNNLLKNIVNPLIFNKESFVKFIDLITNINNSYNSCISTYSNKNFDQLLNFLEIGSKLVEFPINKLILMSQNIPDNKLESIIKLQLELDSLYILKLVGYKNAKNNYGASITFISSCYVNKKMMTFKYLISKIDLSTFIDILISIKEHIPSEFEKYFCDYINANNHKIKEYHNINNLIDSLLNKPKILKTIFGLISESFDTKIKKTLLDKIVNSNILDVELIFTILEGGNIIPDMTTLNNLLSKVYFRNCGASNCKQIAEIIDIFILYKFVITKEILILLLKHGCYVNSIEKYSIVIDDLILEECAELGYYPYEFTIIPSLKIMLKECGKESNLERIKKLKEKGGILHVSCLEKACGIRKNGKVIKYLIVECNLKPNDICLQNYQETYGMEALDIIIKNYDNTNIINHQLKDKSIEVDIDSTMTIERREIVIDKELDYILKTKIKKLFDVKKKIIKYRDLMELMLKYIINNKLIIGNYFVINKELSLLLKLNQCTIIHVDQLDNILSYFIDLP